MEVYLNKLFFSIDNENWKHSKNWFSLEENIDHLEYVSNEMSFEETYNYLIKKNIANIYLDETLFTHKKIIWIYDSSSKCYKYKNFKTFKYRIVKEKYNNLDLNYILSRFPAESTIKYLIDHGISIGGKK